MIGPPPGTRVYLACGVTDMRAGMDRLATLVQQSLGANPFDGAVYLFRGRRGRCSRRFGMTGLRSAFSCDGSSTGTSPGP